MQSLYIWWSEYAFGGDSGDFHQGKWSKYVHVPGFNVQKSHAKLKGEILHT